MHTPQLPYRDRKQAGEVLAAALMDYRGRPGLLVLGLPRGGVPVAHVVAQALDAPLDVFIVRKLGYPGDAEYAFGAIASGGVQVMRLPPGARLVQGLIDRVVAREQAELARREELFRRGRPPLDVRGRTVIVVDDGLATGATMEAAARALRQLGPAHLCVAVPVGAPDSCASISALADVLVCPAQPAFFGGVSSWYEDFRQTSDEEVWELLSG